MKGLEIGDLNFLPEDESVIADVDLLIGDNFSKQVEEIDERIPSSGGG